MYRKMWGTDTQIPQGRGQVKAPLTDGCVWSQERERRVSCLFFCFFFFKCMFLFFFGIFSFFPPFFCSFGVCVFFLLLFARKGRENDKDKEALVWWIQLRKNRRAGRGGRGVRRESVKRQCFLSKMREGKGGHGEREKGRGRHGGGGLGCTRSDGRAVPALKRRGTPAPRSRSAGT